jgi:TRAP-type C4-dicarboxylate transport system permease small subunit
MKSNRFSLWVLRVCNSIAGCCVVAMMALTSLDVIMRYFSRPIYGVYEIVGLLGAIVYTTTLPDATANKVHVRVELFVQLLSPRYRTVLNVVTTLASALLLGLITWQSIRCGLSLRQAGEVSMDLRIPFHYTLFLISASSAVGCLILISQVVKLYLDRKQPIGSKA